MIRVRNSPIEITWERMGNVFSRIKIMHDMIKTSQIRIK